MLGNDPAWMLTPAHMVLTDSTKFPHCLLMHRNSGVFNAVLDAPSSLIIRKAGNRTISMQTVRHELLKSQERFHKQSLFLN